MGQGKGGLGGDFGGGKKGRDKNGDKDKKTQLPPPVPTQIGKKKRMKGPDASSKLPLVTPHTRLFIIIQHFILTAPIHDNC